MGPQDAQLVDQEDLFPTLDKALYEKWGWGVKGPNKAEARYAWDMCAEDPAAFIFGGFVRTFDEHDRQHPVKPFPHKSYLLYVLRYIHNGGTQMDDSDVVAISKSRQLSMTWLACAYAVWDAHFHDHRKVMIQSKKAEDAWRLVYWKHWQAARCGFIIRAMPRFMRHIVVGKNSRGEDKRLGAVGTKGEIIYPNGSTIMGVPEGGHQFRSHVASLVISDECCFQPEFEDAFTAALAMAKGGGKIVLITTAAAGTYYSRLVEEETEEQAA